MRKRLVRITVIPFIIFSSISLGGLFWLRGEGLRSFIIARLERDLIKYNLSIKYSDFQLDPLELQASFKDLDVYITDKKESIAKVEKVYLQMRLRDIFSPSFEVEQVGLLRPQLCVRFDSEGVSNLSKIKLPETESKESELPSTIINITEGKVIYDDQHIDFTGEFNNLSFGVIPIPNQRNILSIKLGKSEIGVGKKSLQIEELLLRLRLFKERAEIESLALKTAFSNLMLSGTITDLKKFDYNFNLFAKLDLENASKLLLENQKGFTAINGVANIRGQLTGQWINYRLNGSIESEGISSASTEVTGFRLDTELGSSKDIFQLSGNLQLAKIRYGKFILKAFSSPLFLTAEKLELPSLKLEFLGGKVEGKAIVALNEKGSSYLSTSFTNIDIATLNTVLIEDITKKSLKLEGTVSGKTDSNWKGSSFNQLKTQAKLKIAAKTVANEAIAIKADIEATISDNLLTLSQANFATDNTKLNLNGSVNGSNFKLNVDLESANIEEGKVLARQLELFQLPEEKNEIGAVGKLLFKGEVNSSPSINGELFVEKLLFSKQEIGSFSGSILYSTNQLFVKNAQFDSQGSGSLSIDFKTTLSEDGETSAKFHFDSFSLPAPVIKLVSEELVKGGSVQVYTILNSFDGKIDGRVDLEGLPSLGAIASNKVDSLQLLLKQIEGGIDLKIRNMNPEGSFKTADLGFAVRKEKLDFNQLNIELPIGFINGKATYDTNTGDYKIGLGSKKLDISGLKSFKERKVSVAPIKAEVSGAGNISDPKLGIFLSSSRLMIGESELKDLELVTSTVNGVAELNLKASYLDSPYNLSGKVKLADDLPLEAEIKLKDRSILPLLNLFISAPPRLNAAATGSLKIRGPLAGDEGIGIKDLKVVADLTSLAMRVEAVEEGDLAYLVANDGAVMIEADSKKISFKNLKLKGEGTSLAVSGNLSSTTNSSLQLQGELNLKLINTFSRSLSVGGIASVTAAVVNSPKEPARLTGKVDLSNVSFRYLGFPLAVQEGKGRLLFTANRAVIESFVAKSGAGQITLDGGAVLDNFVPERFRVGIKGKEVRVNYPSSVRSIVDGELVVQGGRRFQLISGNVNIRRAEYTQFTDIRTVTAIFSNTDITTVVPTLGNNIFLDVTLTARESVIINNNLADLVGSGSIKLNGKLDDLVISGQARITKGSLILRDDRYNISQGVIDFPENRNGQTRFVFEADTEIQGYRIVLNFTGTPSRINSVLRSEPALSQSDIVSLLTTGQISQNITGITQETGTRAIESQAAVSILTGTLSEQIEQRTGKLFGLNRFQVDPLLAGRGANPTARITLGRRVTKDLSVTYSADLTTGREQVVVIEYRLNRNVSLVGVREQDGTYGFDVRFRKRF
ncbi:MAG: translocation/assembly module TamB [Blastocatellia bacterium]|nr:translocation/assembly module TamB [Blastocatellia bacterium]